ncbi:hypothetical protein WJX74_000820 [Apatococcus lobatus]|uniref:Uncharacterized protein n=1 Tax=Apatococcus lobatus TaxID=904363 RepID=A0AAW1REZ1_9CHLO
MQCRTLHLQFQHTPMQVGLAVERGLTGAIHWCEDWLEGSAILATPQQHQHLQLACFQAAIDELADAVQAPCAAQV